MIFQLFVCFHLLCNITSFAKECNIGYIGSNCSRPCRYPSYGKGCQHECSNCSKENCDARFGCLTPNVSIDTDNTRLSEDSIQLIYVTIGLISSGFFIIFTSVACMFLIRGRSARHERSRY
uniref:TNFR-Cys domain-containing protein n=1 Tax=Magallana gigas TaxID=29159 RepID=A0A8W8MNB3_MAGGI